MASHSKIVAFRQFWLLCLSLFATVLLFAPPTHSAETEVDLELILAVDVSRSMDRDEQKLQRDGYVAAVQHPSVLYAISQGLLGKIAVTYVEWAGQGLQKVTVPWTIISGKSSAEQFARRLGEAPLIQWRRTGISGALLAAADLFENNGYRGLRRVVDVSGDGPNNSGIPVYEARDRLIKKGIIINGLPIMLKSPQWSGFFDIENLDIYYEDCVIGGPGSFWIAVRDAKEFANAIRRKLLLEIAYQDNFKLQRAFVGRKQARIDCLIGEKRWQQYFDNFE